MSKRSKGKRDAETTVADAGARQMQIGWWALLGYLSLGVVLEALHGFKAGLYLDVDNETRRLMWTLAHAHGTLLALVSIVFGVACRAMPDFEGGARDVAARCLLAALVLVPLGFLLGGAFTPPGRSRTRDPARPPRRALSLRRRLPDGARKRKVVSGRTRPALSTTRQRRSRPVKQTCLAATLCAVALACATPPHPFARDGALGARRAGGLVRRAHADAHRRRGGAPRGARIRQRGRARRRVPPPAARVLEGHRGGGSAGRRLSLLPHPRLLAPRGRRQPRSALRVRADPRRRDLSRVGRARLRGARRAAALRRAAVGRHRALRGLPHVRGDRARGRRLVRDLGLRRRARGQLAREPARCDHALRPPRLRRVERRAHGRDPHRPGRLGGAGASRQRARPSSPPACARRRPCSARRPEPGPHSSSAATSTPAPPTRWPRPTTRTRSAGRRGAT